MSISASRLAALKPADRAIFAVNARLISCLVTESLLRALYFPIDGFEATGICVVLGNSASSGTGRIYESSDILAVVPLRYVPLLRQDGTGVRGKAISLLDPLDMMPLVFEVDVDGINTPEIEVPTDILFADYFLS